MPIAPQPTRSRDSQDLPALPPIPHAGGAARSPCRNRAPPPPCCVLPPTPLWMSPPIALAPRPAAQPPRPSRPSSHSTAPLQIPAGRVRAPARGPDAIPPTRPRGLKDLPALPPILRAAGAARSHHPPPPPPQLRHPLCPPPGRLSPPIMLPPRAPP